MRRMIAILSNIFNGVAIPLSAVGDDRKYISLRNGFQRDNEKLRSDIRRVGDDLRKSAEEAYGR